MKKTYWFPGNQNNHITITERKKLPQWNYFNSVWGWDYGFLLNYYYSSNGDYKEERPLDIENLLSSWEEFEQLVLNKERSYDLW